MATKKQLAEQVMRVVSGGHIKPDRTIDIREIMLYIDQLRDKAVVKSVYESLNLGEYEVDETYLSFYESVTVNAAGTNGLKYITLPASVISLPYGIGLYQITPVNDMEDAYIITKPGQFGIYAGTDALSHTGKTYCFEVNGVVYFKNIPDAVSAVTVLMAASSKDIAEGAEFPMPPDTEAEIIQAAIQMFGVMQGIPHDELEDGQK